VLENITIISSKFDFNHCRHNGSIELYQSTCEQVNMAVDVMLGKEGIIPEP